MHALSRRLLRSLPACDILALSSWFRSNVTPVELEQFKSTGIVGNVRFTPAAVNVFMCLWSWSSPKFHGDAGRRQDGFYARKGNPALLARFQAIQAVISDLTSSTLLME